METYGDYVPRNQSGEEYLTLAFSPSSRPLKDRWRNNGLSADFLADYFVTFMPQDLPEIRYNAVKGAVAYIANELLENAMKFACTEGCDHIALTLDLEEDSLAFTLVNGVVPESLDRLRAFLGEFVSMDPGDFFVLQMERNAESGEESGLGFATMSTDYEARVGWYLENDTDGDGLIRLTTRVFIGL